MDMVRKEIFDTIEDRDDLNLTKVALLIGSSKQALSDYKKGKKNIGFRKLIRLAYLLFPHPREKIAEWCIKLDSVESIKQAFEYAAAIRDIDLLKRMLTKHKSENGVVGECVRIYSIIYKFMTNKIKGTDLLTEVKKIKTPADKSLEILLDIIKTYYYYYNREFWLMLESSKNIVNEILGLSDKREHFIKESYFHRICEMYGHAYLHLNNLKLARVCGEILIHANFCARTVSDGYYIVGMSFLLEDKRKCLDNLQASYDILKDSGDQELINLAKYNLNFAKAYRGEKLDNDAPSELKAFFSAKWSEGNVLSDLEEDINLEEEKEFQHYFRALAEKSTDKLIECHGLFFNKTNFFFAGVVAKDLERLGENTSLIESLIKFKVNKEGELKIEKDFISCFSSFDDSIRCNYV
jgi:hypothetical protein